MYNHVYWNWHVKWIGRNTVSYQLNRCGKIALKYTASCPYLLYLLVCYYHHHYHHHHHHHHQ